MTLQPEQISQYNLYNRYERLVGTTEVTLPTFESMTNTISGAGINGEYESSVPGAFSSTELEIPFRVIDQKAAEILKNEGSTIFLRAAVQSVDSSTNKIVNKSLKITISGRSKGCTIGTAGNAKTMDSSIKLEVTYYKQEFDGVILLEVDKLNNIYVVNGVDQLADIKSMI